MTKPIIEAILATLMALLFVSGCWRMIKRQLEWRKKRKEAKERLYRDGMICIRCGYNMRVSPTRCSECGYEPKSS
jgi:predicted Zn-ribbon and HTH transcriptional regulator